MKLKLLHPFGLLQSLAPVLLVYVVFGWILPSVSTQCCQKFSGGQCVSCPPDTRLVRGNCLLNKPNCASYNLFECIKCNTGYTLNPNNLCVLLSQQGPLTGYFYLSQAEMNSNFIQTLVKQIKRKMSSQLQGLNLITAIAANADQTPKLQFPLTTMYFFRFIFSADQGFLQYNYAYTPPTTANTTNSSNGYTADSTPNLSDFSQRKVKIITLNDENNINQVFIDFRQDPYYSAIMKEIQAKQIKTSNTIFVDVFRYFAPAFQNIPAAYGYRIFLVSPNQGLFYVSKIVDIQTVDIYNLDSMIASVLEEIKRMKNWGLSLNNTQLVNLVVVTNKGGVSTFNATYAHLGTTDPKTKDTGKSWVTFTWQQLPTTIKINVTDSFIYSDSGQSTNTVVKSTTNKPTITPTTPVRPLPPTRKTPSWASIPNTINLQDYISLLQFFKLKDFSSILGYLNSNFVKYTVGQDILRAAQGENATHKIYLIEFKVYSLQQINAEYIFTLEKQKNQLDIVQLIITTAANRTDIMVDGRNRQSVINGFDNATKTMVKNIVIADPLYNPAAELFQYSTLIYKPTQTSLPTKQISLRYYFPAQLNKTYEFIEYRSQIWNYPNSSNIQKINTIIYPKQAYQLVDQNDTLTRDTVIFAVEQLLMKELEKVNYTFNRVYKSLDRIGFFRVQLDYFDQFAVLYEFDSNTNNYIRSITNKTIAKTKPANNVTIITKNDTITSSISLASFIKLVSVTDNTKRLLLSYTAPPTEPIPQKAYNPLYLFQYFPSKISKPIPLNATLASTDSAFLSINEIKKIIADFFKISQEQIIQVTILSHQTIQHLIDTYNVEFTKTTNNLISFRGTNRDTATSRFKFQVERKNKISPKNIVGAARLSEKESIRPRPVFGLSWIFNPILDIFSKTLSINQFSKPAPLGPVNPIVIPFEQTSNKPVSILQQLLDQPVRISNPRPNNPSLSFSKQKLVEEFLQNLPKIIPIVYQQDLGFNQVSPAELNKPNVPSEQAINLLVKKITFPTVFNKNLALIQNQRTKKNDTRNAVNLVNIDHAYYGSIRAWCSLASEKINRIEYADEFLLKNRGTSLILQINSLNNVHQLLSDKISQTLTYFGYSQHKAPKVISQKDIIYWKYKKLNNIKEVQLYYEFETFIVKSNAVMNSSDYRITELILINNNKKSNQKLVDLRKVIYSNYFMKANYQLFYQFGFYFENGEIVDVSQVSADQNIVYFVTFLTPNGFINVNMTFNIPTLQTSIETIQLANIEETNLFEGCQKFSQIPLQCDQCYPSHYLHKNDKKCYLKIQNCLYQSRQICLECENGYFLLSDQCS